MLINLSPNSLATPLVSVFIGSSSIPFSKFPPEPAQVNGQMKWSLYTDDKLIVTQKSRFEGVDLVDSC